MLVIYFLECSFGSEWLFWPQHFQPVVLSSGNLSRSCLSISDKSIVSTLLFVRYPFRPCSLLPRSKDSLLFLWGLEVSDCQACDIPCGILQWSSTPYWAGEACPSSVAALGCKNFLGPYVEVSNITSSRSYSFDLPSPFNSISTIIIVGGGTPIRDFSQAFPNIFHILLFYDAAGISINMVSYSPLSKGSTEKRRSKIQGFYSILHLQIPVLILLKIVKGKRRISISASLLWFLARQHDPDIW